MYFEMISHIMPYIPLLQRWMFITFITRISGLERSLVCCDSWDYLVFETKRAANPDLFCQLHCRMSARAGHAIKNLNGS